jgi:hypothetical protein
MKMLILISLIGAAAAKACGKGAAEAGSVAKVGAKNAGKFAGASAKYNKVAMTKEDILRQGLEKASMRNTKYLMNDLNTNDSRIYFKDSIVVMDNTRE